MDAYKAIITKRDTRSYTKEPISEEVLLRLVQAGRMAGSAKNRQPVRFVVIVDKVNMANIAKCGDFSQPLEGATAAIGVCLAPDESEFDAGRAAQNIMIAAWNEGLASCPLRIHHVDCGRETLGLPEGWYVPIVIALGHPEPSVPMSMGRARKPIDEYVSWEKYGQKDPK